MDASVLVVGNSDFSAHLSKQMQNLVEFHIAVTTTTEDADALIHDRPPDLLILQMGQVGGIDLCRRLKQYRRFAWIYCILIDLRSRQSTVDPLAALASEAAEMAEALESGADAFLRLGSPELSAEGLSSFTHRLANADLNRQQTRLLQAQMQTGLHRARSLRELIRANDLLSTMALSDPLTELNNRRALEWELPRQIKNARVRLLPLSVMMLDIDYFKTVNDTYGHLVGDRVLQLLAERLRYNMRFYDTPFRYGGEEFVVILNSTSAQEASRIARRVCRLVQEHPFRVSDTLSLPLTVSVGTSSLQPEDDDKGMSLLERADGNLLRAKAAGRNQAITSLDLPSHQDMTSS